MNQSLTTVQPILIGAVFLWASGFKLLAKSAPQAAEHSALRTLVGAERVLRAYRAVGVGELLVAAVVLAPPAHWAKAAVALAGSLGLLGYLTYAKVVAPESSCGCLSEKQTPVRWRAFARAGVLVVASALALFASGYWVPAVLDRPVATLAVLVVEFLAVVALSSELDGYWLVPLRRLRVRISHPLARRVTELPFESTTEQVYRSEAYRAVVHALRSDVLEHWDEGDWRIVIFAARTGDGAATAVFAVPRNRYAPEEVKVVLVDEAAPELAPA